MRSEDPATLLIIDLWSFKSEKSNKRYIVEVERFSFNFVGLKFYWKGVANSKLRYSLLTNDYEPRTIVMSCIMIMMRYYERIPIISFGFVAAEDLACSGKSKESNRRFSFYKRMMLTMFGPATFIQAYDVNKSLYMLINKKSYDRGNVNLGDIEREISKLYEGDFTLTLNHD